eukprot:SAG11_NODE_11077_length_785_cov_1.097668_1_plen_48_part_10
MLTFAAQTLGVLENTFVAPRLVSPSSHGRESHAGWALRNFAAVGSRVV